jgi:hypothetical protein
MSKRYWQIAFPLAITALCVAPQQYFLKHWQPFFENSISKLKVRSFAWVYPSICLIVLTVITGEAISTYRIEWTHASRVDISVSLSRVTFNDNVKARSIFEAFLSTQSDYRFPL